MAGAGAWLKPSKSQFSLWKTLGRTAGRRPAGLFLAEGGKVVGELLKSKWQLRNLLLLEGKTATWKTIVEAAPPGTGIYCLTAKEWRLLSQDQHPEGIMAVAASNIGHDLSSLSATKHLLLAHRVNNPNNLGALMRSAHWFGFGGVLLSGDSVDPTNPKVVRTSMGSLFHIDVLTGLDFGNAIPALKRQYVVVAGVPQKGKRPHPCPHPTALLLGSESHGLPDSLLALADERWSIPARGTAESLSLPQAAAIMMYELAKTP